MKACKDKDVSKLVSEIANPHIPTCIQSLPDHPQDPHDWGLKHEETARSTTSSAEAASQTGT